MRPSPQGDGRTGASAADYGDGRTGASSDVSSHRSTLRYGLESVMLYAEELNRLDGVQAWIDAQVPGLRRRLALARFIESQVPGLQSFVQLDEAKLPTGPIAASFTHLLLSPGREFEADRLAAQLCESPHGLADALVRLDQASELVEFTASPATEPLYTVNPFAEEGLAKLFVTHPPVGERVRRLRELDPDWREKLQAA